MPTLAGLGVLSEVFVLKAEVFVLKAKPSWLKLKRHEWKRLRGFTVGVLFNQTNKQTDISTCVCIVYWIEVN